MATQALTPDEQAELGDLRRDQRLGELTVEGGRRLAALLAHAGELDEHGDTPEGEDAPDDYAGAGGPSAEEFDAELAEADAPVDPEHPNLLARGYTAARGEVIGSASRIQAAGLVVIDEAIHYAEGSLTKAKAQGHPNEALAGIGDELRILRACRRLVQELNKIAEGQQARARLLGGQ